MATEHNDTTEEKDSGAEPNDYVEQYAATLHDLTDELADELHALADDLAAGDASAGDVDDAMKQLAATYPAVEDVADVADVIDAHQPRYRMVGSAQKVMFRGAVGDTAIALEDAHELLDEAARAHIETEQEEGDT